MLGVVDEEGVSVLTAFTDLALVVLVDMAEDLAAVDFFFERVGGILLDISPP